MTQTPRTILAMDAAGSACAVAVCRDGAALASRVEPMRRGQAERLVPLIEATLHDAGMAAAALDMIAASTGPGGFTGVRIGLATARGYALGLNIPVIGVSRFETIAATALPLGGSSDRLLVALDARRAEILLQTFDAEGNAVEAPWESRPDDVAGLIRDRVRWIAGDAGAAVAEALGRSGHGASWIESTATIEPAVLARIGAARAHTAESGRARPLYLRAPDVTPPNGGFPERVVRTIA